MELCHVFANILHVQRSREFCEPFTHPLISVARPPEDVAPPLVRCFVWTNIAPKIARPAFRAEQLCPLRCIDEGGIWHVDQSRPRLPKVHRRLLSQSNPGIRELPKYAE